VQLGGADESRHYARRNRDVLLKRRLSVLWAAAIMLLTVLVCSGIALAITFGTDDVPNNPDYPKYPGVGALVSEEEGAYCSGTLVAGKNNGPPAFVTAAHCYPLEGNTSYVTFASPYIEGSSPEYKGTWHEDDQPYLRGHDIAVVVFDNPPQSLLDLPRAKLPTQGSLNNLGKGRKFTAVGYGVTSGTSDDSGTRRYSVSKLTSTNTYFLGLSQNVNQGNSGTCYGDSGGPNFVWTRATTTAPSTETNINAALTNTGDAMCKSKNTVLRLDTKVAHDFLDDYVASTTFVPILQQ